MTTYYTDGSASPNPGYAKFKAYQHKNVYGCNTGDIPFYEESPFQPDRLLKDLIKIFHPSLLKEYDLKYFRKLAE